MINIQKQALFAGLFVFLTSNCKTEKPQEEPAAATKLPAVTNQFGITYEGAIRAHMGNYCVSCHGATPPNLASYSAVRNAASASLNSILNGRMPPKTAKQMPVSAVNDFKAWVNAGAPERQTAIPSTNTNPAGANTNPAGTNTNPNTNNSNVNGINTNNVNSNDTVGGAYVE